MTVTLAALLVGTIALGWWLGSWLLRQPPVLEGFEDATGGFKRWRDAMAMGERAGADPARGER